MRVGPRILILLAAVLTVGCAPLAAFRSPRPSPEIESAMRSLAIGDTAKATAIFDAEIRKNPLEPAPYEIASGILMMRGHAELAIKYAEPGLKAVPAENREGRARLYIALGGAYDASGNREGFIRASHDALKLTPDDPHALNGLGYAYAQAGKNLDEALRITTRAIDLARKQNMPDKSLAAIVDTLGWLYYKMGNLDEAVNYLSRAADMAPDHWEIHDHLSQAYRAKGMANEARIESERARTARTAGQPPNERK